MSLSKRIAYNSAIQVLGKVLGTIFGLLAVASFARYLGSRGFGDYTTATAFASLFAIAADLGLTLVTSQMINKSGQKQERVIANLMSFRLVTALVLIGLAPIVGQLMPYHQGVKLGIWLAAGAFFCGSLNQVFVAIFQKHLRTDFIALAEVISRALLAAGAWLVAWFDWGLAGVLWSMLAANAVSFGLHWHFARRFERIGLAWDWPLWQEIGRRAWPLLATIVLNLIYLKADIVILSLLDRAEVVGLYGAAYKVVDVLVSLPFMFAGLVLPMLVAAWSEMRRADYRLAWQNFFDYTAIVAWPLVLGGIVLSVPIMALIAGREFLAAGPLLSILMLAVLAVFVSCVFTHTMISWEQQSKLIGLYLLTAITALPIYYFGIKWFSATGAAWATVYSEALIMFGSAWIAGRRLGFAISWVKFIKSAAAAAVMAGLIICLGWLPLATGAYLLLALAAGTVCYLWLLAVFGVLTGQDWRRLLGKRVGASTIGNL